MRFFNGKQLSKSTTAFIYQDFVKRKVRFTISKNFQKTKKWKWIGEQP